MIGRYFISTENIFTFLFEYKESFLAKIEY